jgi:hypothetical protein
MSTTPEATPTAEQLSLLALTVGDLTTGSAEMHAGLQVELPQPGLPLQFRLDRRTRERGLAHVAAIKAQLAARAAARQSQAA